ncbi:MAG: hypothetical protein OEW68_10255 [Gammaproteobacteria bacterium]|nr:hypothetical protein [Gammaproteobacteria bacterium]MDH4315209.1 hypothetical protein [Gammaproteobacteria bacterium]MDH5502247.1 hypothetical protein [Gammaproteobacteria bacterium]
MAVVTLAALIGLPLLAAADDIPPSIAALLPTGAEPGKGSFTVMESEFGKTFGADVRASSFPGQRPSCVYAGTTELYINIKGDTAFENPPMLDMAISIHEQEIERAPAAMSSFVSTYIKGGPDVVSVGELREEKRPNGHIVYVEYQENCSSHPNGAKTRLSGFARRGATQLDFQFVVALDSAAALKMADEILANFGKLDIASLTQ